MRSTAAVGRRVGNNCEGSRKRSMALAMGSGRSSSVKWCSWWGLRGRGRPEDSGTREVLAIAENLEPALGSPMTSHAEGCSVLGRLGDGEGGAHGSRLQWLIRVAVVEAHNEKNRVVIAWWLSLWRRERNSELFMPLSSAEDKSGLGGRGMKMSGVRSVWRRWLVGLTWSRYFPNEFQSFPKFEIQNRCFPLFQKYSNFAWR
jgi:hypothetical protein